MKYKAKYDKFEKLSDDELLHNLLTERGIGDVEGFINLNENCLCDAKEFENMCKGLNLIDKYIENGGKVCIIVDSDIDGYSSSAFTYLELKKLNPNLDIKYIIHRGKEHGINHKELEKIDYDFDLLIVPDAGSSNYIERFKLEKMNKDILVLDHHNFTITKKKGELELILDGRMTKKPNNTIIINNQDGKYKNPTLSGVGVVYKFFNLYEKLANNKNYSDDMLDLVAVGMIGDCMSMKNFETRYLCLKGIELLNNGKGNKFLKEIFEKLKGRIGDELTIKTIGWNIVPLFNSMVRSGKMEEKIDTFEALIESNKTRIYQPRRKRKTDSKPESSEETLQQSMTRVLTNVKSRQDRLVTKQFNELNEKIQEENLAKNKVIIVNATNELDSTFTGYVANKISSYYHRPALVLKQNGDKEFGGSGRNYRLFEVDNLASLLNESKLMNKVAGHSDAMGIGIDIDKVEELNNWLNTRLKDVKIEDVYHVDYAIPVGRLKEKQIKQVGKFEKIWGNDLEEPLFCIKDIYLNVEDIKLLGEKQNVLSITKTIGSNTLKFINTFNAKEMYNKITGKNIKTKGLIKKLEKPIREKICLEIIGEFTINKWNNNEYPQIKIVDFNIIENKKREIKF